MNCLNELGFGSAKLPLYVRLGSWLADSVLSLGVLPVGRTYCGLRVRAETEAEAVAVGEALAEVRSLAPLFFTRISENADGFILLGAPGDLGPFRRVVTISEGIPPAPLRALELVHVATRAWLYNVGHFAANTPTGARVHAELGRRAALKYYERWLVDHRASDQAADRQSVLAFLDSLRRPRKTSVGAR